MNRPVSVGWLIAESIPRSRLRTSDAPSAIRAGLSWAAPVASLYSPSASRSHAYDVMSPAGLDFEASRATLAPSVQCRDRPRRLSEARRGCGLGSFASNRWVHEIMKPGARRCVSSCVCANG